MSVSAHAGRSGAQWRACIEWFRKNVPWICARCGGDIPKGVNHQTDKLGHTLNHKVSIEIIRREKLDPALIYDHSNLEPMHRMCNSSKGLSDEDQPVIVSRQW